jgi:hypothetical protein
MGDEVFDHHVFERARAIPAIDESHIGQGLRQDDDEGRRSSGTDLPVDLLRQPSPRPLASPAAVQEVEHRVAPGSCARRTTDGRRRGWTPPPIRYGERYEATLPASRTCRGVPRVGDSPTNLSPNWAFGTSTPDAGSLARLGRMITVERLDSGLRPWQGCRRSRRRLPEHRSCLHGPVATPARS